MNPANRFLSPLPATVRAGAILPLAAILLLAAVLRLPQLGQRGYLYDEAWVSEIALGRGAVHLNLPWGAVIPTPDPFAMASAPPWWHVWTHMQQTHPPLYFILLRWWMDLLGQGDGRERLLSVLFSLAAIALLFDSVRLLNGKRVAIWAALLMAVAAPQIDNARQTRNYMMAVAAVLAAVDALVRIERLGVSRRRIIALAAASLAAVLTHYFTVAPLAALAAYALYRLPRPAAQRVLAALAAAAVLFAIAWGPFMWQQRARFSPSDEANLFLQEHDPAHTLRSLHRALLIPIDLLAEPALVLVPLATLAGAAIYFAPLLLLRRRPDLLLWALLLLTTIGLVLIFDVARQTRQLMFIRYTLLAGPPVYALIPASISTARGWLPHALPALMLLLTLAAVDQGYPTTITDPHRVINDLQPLVRPNDFFVFIGTGNLRWEAEAHYLVLARYLRPLPKWMALEDNLPTPPVVQQALASPRTIAYTQTEDPRLYFPTLTPIAFHSYYGRGQVWVMAPLPNR